MADAVQIFPPGFRITTTAGLPVSGATIEVYVAASTEAKEVFSDKDLTASIGSIVYCDSAGHPVAAFGSSTKILVYTDDVSYKLVIKDASGTTLATYDNIKGAVVAGAGGGGGTGITEAEADLRYVRNPNALATITAIDATDILSVWDVSAGANKGITWANKSADLLSEWRTAGHVFSPAGASQLFLQAAAPTGWTKQTTHTNKAIRMTNGTGGLFGGTVDFTTAFASKSVTGTVGSTTLVEATTPGHTHAVAINYYSLVQGGGGSVPALVTPASGFVTGSVNESTDAFGGGGSHTHSFTGTAINMAVQYVDAIWCDKD